MRIQRSDLAPWLLAEDRRLDGAAIGMREDEDGLYRSASAPYSRLAKISGVVMLPATLATNRRPML